MTLLETRKKYNLSQLESANLLNVPLRTFVRYEKDNTYGDSFKRQMMIKILNDICGISENKGLLTVELIKDLTNDIFNNQYKGKVEFCYLFGSYAKGYAKENSDVDLCVATDLTGLNFLGLVEELRTILNKKVDVIRFSDLENNLDLAKEIMKDGIKIYG